MEWVKQVSLDVKKWIRQNFSIRWNSTFLMLDGITYYKKALCHLQLSDSNFKSCPSKEE